jgi:hypothetical protein
MDEHHIRSVQSVVRMLPRDARVKEQIDGDIYKINRCG